MHAGRSVVERWHGRSVRAWQPGTHARPAAGGEPRQELSRRTGTRTGAHAGADCPATEGARLVTRPDVPGDGAPAGAPFACTHRERRRISGLDGVGMTHSRVGLTRCGDAK